MRKRSGNDIEDAAFELEQCKARYLRSHGWRYTSESPGCIWMWIKQTTIDNAPCWIMVDTDTAVAIQRYSVAIRGNEW